MTPGKTTSLKKVRVCRSCVILEEFQFLTLVIGRWVEVVFQLVCNLDLKFSDYILKLRVFFNLEKKSRILASKNIYKWINLRLNKSIHLSIQNNANLHLQKSYFWFSLAWYHSSTNTLNTQLIAIIKNVFFFWEGYNTWIHCIWREISTHKKNEILNHHVLENLLKMSLKCQSH